MRGMRAMRLRPLERDLVRKLSAAAYTLNVRGRRPCARAPDATRTPDLRRAHRARGAAEVLGEPSRAPHVRRRSCWRSSRAARGPRASCLAVFVRSHRSLLRLRAANRRAARRLRMAGADARATRRTRESTSPRATTHGERHESMRSDAAAQRLRPRRRYVDNSPANGACFSYPRMTMRSEFGAQRGQAR